MLKITMMVEVTIKKRKDLLVAIFPKKFVEEQNIKEGDKLSLISLKE